jgi:energy-coupling factor transporter transmembrane protein EcfT
VPLEPVSDIGARLRSFPSGQIPPVVLALVAQLAAGATLLALRLSGAVQAPAPVALVAHGLLAAALGACLRLPAWWLPINVLFIPAAVMLREWELPPAVFLGGFILLALMFWTTFRTRVPLYLSSREAGEKLAELVPQTTGVRLLDLGCGFGGLLRQLTRLRPRATLEGVEIAPLPALVAWLRLHGLAGCKVRRTDFWRLDLSQYDVVYAFLSPAPMAKLWDKVRREMRPGTLFVSNSFAVPGNEPDRVVPLDGAGSGLYVWRL